MKITFVAIVWLLKIKINLETNLNSFHSKSYRWHVIIYDAAFHDPYLKKIVFKSLMNFPNCFPTTTTCLMS